MHSSEAPSCHSTSVNGGAHVSSCMALVGCSTIVNGSNVKIMDAVAVSTRLSFIISMGLLYGNCRAHY
jgi:hypothetical protein